MRFWRFRCTNDEANAAQVNMVQSVFMKGGVEWRRSVLRRWRAALGQNSKSFTKI